MPPPSSYPTSLGAASPSTNPAMLASLNRLTHQLNASREDLAHERQGRDIDRMFYEQELAMLREQVANSSGWQEE